MQTRLIKTATLLLLLLPLVNGVSGELAPKLVDQIAASSADQLISVWIEMVKNETPAEFKSSVRASSRERSVRHEFAIGRLKQASASAQKSVLSELSSLRGRRAAASVRSYWIANVITAEISAAELERIARRPEVVTIYAVPKIEIIAPVSVSSSPLSPETVESNLTYIRAITAWGMGFTGAGRIVCSFDTGVDGEHPALKGNWKGKDGDSAAAWFDPLFDQPAPHVLSGSSSPSHGTWTTGVLLGHDDNSGDTVGVAPDAKWIATYVTNIAGASLFDAFEWAADPDRNPNTIADVPDVINHSWGFVEPFPTCVNLLYDLIENTEALGIVSIFAAGNRGASPGSVQNPADGALSFDDSLSSFAVGSVDHRAIPVSIVGTSARGPSPCFGAIKPNVVAPGQSIRTSNPGATPYASITGTSLAAPHVSGLVALLREKNPNATVDEIKNAILNSTNRANFGPVPNNNAGWGEIDCVEALNTLSASNLSPNVQLYDFAHAPIAAGDTVRGVVSLKNFGANASSVSVVITGNDPDLSPLSTSAFFGSITEGQVVVSNDTIEAVVGSNVVSGTRLKLSIAINGIGFNIPTSLYFQVGSIVAKEKVDHNTGQIAFTVTNYGVFGIGPGALFNAKGVGFNFKGNGDYLFESGLIIGNGFTSVSSGVHGTLDEPNMDFVPAAGGDLIFDSPGALVHEQTTSKFSDNNAVNPIGLTIAQETFADTSNPDIIAMKYTINNPGAIDLTGLYVGLFLDWDVSNPFQNAGGYDATDQFLWTSSNSFGTKSRYRGVRMIEGAATTALTGEGGPSTIWLPDPFDPLSGDGFTDVEKFNALRSGMGSATTHVNSSTELYQLMATGPLNIPSGQSKTLTFALLAGDSLIDIRDAAIRSTTLIPNCCSDLTGNVDCDPGGIVDITDLTVLIDHLFITFQPLCCVEAANIDGDQAGVIDITDLTFLIDHLFISLQPVSACQ